MDKTEHPKNQTSNSKVNQLRVSVVKALKSSEFGKRIYTWLISLSAVRNYTNRMDFGDRFDGAKEYFHNNADRISAIEAFLADQLSIDCYRAVRSAMETQTAYALNKYLQPAKNQYFDPSIPLRREDYQFFVDCGAFTGDTLESLCSFIGGASQISAYYGFEPDERNLEQLQRTASALGVECIEIFSIAAWNKKETLLFTQSGSSGSHIDASRGNPVSADELDHVLDGKRITMLKMDIEGAEMQALLGAEEIIRKCRPILAICIYHSMRDMIEIPEYIHKIYPDSKIYLRNYSKCLYGECVLYAIPTHA